MDRNKSSSSTRGPKSKITQYPADIFALGSKSTSSRDDSKRSGQHKSSSSHSQSSSSSSKGDRKRESTALPSVIPSKKPKVGTVIRAVNVSGPSSGGSSSSASASTTSDRDRSGDRSGSDRTSSGHSVELWETLAIECDACDLIPNIAKALDKGDNDKIVAYLSGAIKTLRSQRFKPDRGLFLSVLDIAKRRPSLFINEHVTAAYCSLLKRSAGETAAHSLKNKGNPTVLILCTNVLQKAYVNEKHWPEIFVRLYVEDALGDRIWVDHEECKGFVDNIITAFNTRVPPKSLLTPELSAGALGTIRDTSSPIPVTPDDDGGRSTPEVQGMSLHELKDLVDFPVQPRYLQSYEIVEKIVLEAINDQFKRKQPPDTITRNFLRLLSAACGLVEIRMIAVTRLEMWLHNAKLMRPAQELLAYVCSNCSSVTPRDQEVTAQMTKIRLKTKALVNVYLNCLRELVSVHSDNLPPMLKATIYNELSPTRNPNNMPMIAVLFQASPETSAVVLAEIFQDLLIHKDDYLRSLRALLREIVRVLRFDINLYVLCRSLIRERKEFTAALRDLEYRDRVFFAIGDLLCLSMFLGISPQVKEAAQLLSRGDKKEIAALQTYQSFVSRIQRDSVTWLQDLSIRLFRPAVHDFKHVLLKILFLESPDHYYKIDMWPSENDRNLLIRLASEVPLLQATLIRVLLIGIGKEQPLNAVDSIEIADQLIKRAAVLPNEGLPPLLADKLEIVDFIFNLSAYHHPENLTLPQGYTPPQLAISNLYWKGWIMLLMLSAHNPTTFGSLAWKKYPMLRTFMEMCITNHFSYPPPTVAMGEMFDDLKNKELQISALEKQQILEFESHLAAASSKTVITEVTSLLLPQLIEMKPSGESRHPPQGVLDQLHTLNSTHRMGHLLCRSRHPDFLLEIIQRQGSSQHMPWLADLVHNSEGALSHLPVQCLCEYLLISGMQQNSEKNEKHKKHSQVLAHLQTVLTDANQEVNAAFEVLEYFLRRLNSFHCASRVQALKGLKMILSTVTVLVEEEPMDEDVILDSSHERESSNYWLVKQIPALPHFQSIRHLIATSLRQACQVETDPDNISSYISFLAQQTVNDSVSEMGDLVLDLAQLIVERATITSAILPALEQDNNRTSLNTLHSLMIMFCSYLTKLKERRLEPIQWSESQEQILISWGDMECTMHILVIHAMIILLTYGPASDPELFEFLLETWFPINSEPPKAFLIDTTEEALLIPDWLKLRMIRSTVSRLVDAALVNLDPSQLVLFIQSFGIPVMSMSKLLSMLDRSVTMNENAVNEAVLDKSYMAQLVEVQHSRGATGGNTFVQVLQLQEPKLPDQVGIDVGITRQPFPQNLMSQIRRKSVDTNYMIMLLNAIFLKSNYEGDIDKDFGNLLKKLSREIRSNTSNKRITKTFIEYFVSSLTCVEFVNCLLLSESYSCLIFRLLLSTKQNTQELTELCKIIVVKLEDKKTPLAIVLDKYLRKQQVKKTGDKLTIDDGKEVKAIVENPLEVLNNADLTTLERTTKSLVEKSLVHSNNSKLVDSMSNLLLTDIESKRFERTGLLVDWVAELEIEIIGNSPNVQMELLFSNKALSLPSKIKSSSSSHSQNWMSFRPYLVTLLTHRASWRALHACVAQILQPTSIAKYDSEVVLDFLWALTCNPKLWQGRDKNTPKNYRPENVLQLSEEQILHLVDYILQEAMNNNKIESENDTNSIRKIEKRLPLLLQCLEERYDIVSVVVQHLVAIMKEKLEEEVEMVEVITLDDTVIIDEEDNKKSKSDIAQEFLILLYMNIPKVIQYIPVKSKKEMTDLSKIAEYSTSVIDNITHSLITALASTPRAKDWPRKSQEFELLLRKMSAVHPVLILRQLPMIAASLKGRTHLDFSVFKSRNQLNLFTQILGVIELTEPSVFHNEYKDGLEGVLMAYFSLFRYHGHVKELQTMLGKFVNILQGYISFDAPRALKYLQQHAHLLNDLHMTYANLKPLSVLMSSFSLPKEENPLAETSGEIGEVLVAVARVPSPKPVPPNRSNLVLGMSRMQDSEILTALQELDHMSNRRPVILETIVEPLCTLLVSANGSIRQLAHVLLLRHLRHQPATATVESGVTNSVLTAVIEALDSSNSDIVNNLLDRLSDYVVYLQEHSIQILEKAFLLGVKSNVNTTSNITKAIGILNIQSGC